MAGLSEIVEVLFTLFIISVLGYVFILVLWQLNWALAILFVVVIAIAVIAIISRIFRGLSD